MLSLVSAPVLSVCLHMLSLVLVEALVHEAVLAKSIPPIFLLPCPQNCLYSSVKTSGASTESSLLKCHYVQAVIRARLSAVVPLSFASFLPRLFPRSVYMGLVARSEAVRVR